LLAIIHGRKKRLGAITLDQLHDAFGDSHVIQKTVIGIGDNINDRIPDSDDLITLAHMVLSSEVHRSAIMQLAHTGFRALHI